MSGVKTPIANVRSLYRQMGNALEEFERARAVGNFTHERPILDLAQQVIDEVDKIKSSSNAKQLRRLERLQDDAKAIYDMYAPETQSQHPTKTLESPSNRRLLYGMGVIVV